MTDLAWFDGEELNMHFHNGQQWAWESQARFVAITAGTQSGKTSFAPLWLWREMQLKGPGDYLFVTPTFPLLELKALPEFLRVFKSGFHFGYYLASPRRVFVFTPAGCRHLFGDSYDERKDPETRVIFGYATDPESLESATAKAAVLDEAGQKKFKVGAWEAVLRRLSLSMGRVLITTSVYAMNWLKTKIYDAWKSGDPSVDVIQFESTMNPAFPLEEFERARRDLPRWKFDMLYRGLFTRPAGLIYDCFDRSAHTCPRFNIPATWRRFVGLDFGTVNMAAVYLAEEPETGRLYLYRTYHTGGKSVTGHVRQLQHGEPRIGYVVGGSKSEDEWRDEFRKAGLPVRSPDLGDVDVGIDRVYGCIQRSELIVFDDLDEWLEEAETYSRVLDESGEATEAIEDKETYHLLDATRYIIGRIRAGTGHRLRRGRIEMYGRKPVGAGRVQGTGGPVDEPDLGSAPARPVLRRQHLRGRSQPSAMARSTRGA